MYKQLIYAVVAMLIGGAAYYFNQAGVPGLASSGDNRGNGVGAAQVFSGTYMCTEKSGCEYATTLTLEEDTTLDLTVAKDGQESSLGQGTWGVGTGGAIVMLLRNPGLAIETYPSSLIATKASSMKITGFSKKKPLFDGMKDPIFWRIKAIEPVAKPVDTDSSNGDDTSSIFQSE